MGGKGIDLEDIKALRRQGLALNEGDLSEAIEVQEKIGQHESVRNRAIATDMRGVLKKDFEDLGFSFEDSSKGSLFYRAQLPEGWEMTPTSHPMWTDIVDSQGRGRFMQFYKAPFYDRHAFLRPVVRYYMRVERDYIAPHMLAPEERVGVVQYFSIFDSASSNRTPIWRGPNLMLPADFLPEERARDRVLTFERKLYQASDKVIETACPLYTEGSNAWKHYWDVSTPDFDKAYNEVMGHGMDVLLQGD